MDASETPQGALQTPDMKLQDLRSIHRNNRDSYTMNTTRIHHRNIRDSGEYQFNNTALIGGIPRLDQELPQEYFDQGPPLSPSGFDEGGDPSGYDRTDAAVDYIEHRPMNQKELMDQSINSTDIFNEIQDLENVLDGQSYDQKFSGRANIINVNEKFKALSPNN